MTERDRESKRERVSERHDKESERERVKERVSVSRSVYFTWYLSPEAKERDGIRKRADENLEGPPKRHHLIAVVRFVRSFGSWHRRKDRRRKETERRGP